MRQTDPKNKTDLALLGIALLLTGAVLGYTALDAPPLSAPTVAYTPPAASLSQPGVSGPAPGGAPSSGGGSKTGVSSAPSKAASAAPANAASPGTRSVDPSGIRVNLNTADLAELLLLCELKAGVGKATVQNILEYRETYGPFYDAEDLINVKGIGEKTLAKLLPHVYVDEPSSGAR